MAENPIALMMSRFIESKTSRTLLVHGPWGIGKSYAINSFVGQLTAKGSSLYAAHSYVSLFGKPSLAYIQSDIFASAVQIADDNTVREKIGAAGQKYLSLDRYISQSRFQRSLRWISSKVGQVQLPWFGGVGAMLAHGNYELVSSFVVVIDDLERRSQGVGLKDVLGLIDDLATKKNCKVIAIANEDSFDEADQTLMNSFREKVFDVEIKFRRSPRDVAMIGIGSEKEFFEEGVKIYESIGVSNIRVARKFSYFVDQVWGELQGSDPRIVGEVLSHIAIFIWARYDAGAGIPANKLGYLASEQSWMARALREKNQEIEEWEKRWDTAVEALEFSSEPYDVLLVDYLRSGVWVPGDLRRFIEEKSKHLERLEAKERLSAAWRLYSDNLRPDATEFTASLMQVIDNDGRSLSPRDVDSALHILEELGVDVEGVAKKYIEESKDLLQAAALEDWPFGDFKSRSLQPAVQQLRGNGRPIPSIDAALSRIAFERSWSEEDIAALSQCTDEELEAWIESSPDGLPTKIRQGLLFFRNTGGDERYALIGEKAVRVLKKFGRTGSLNKLRVENMFGVKVDDGVAERG